ncbi:hypothetical protein ACH79_40235 [Bradyrhizobium sp. CCBAU 051011]|uniref:hypothetical protein n=1 Tax=Bradyrhizobium sp. CCBAU 051011 TaxID=858422 RepID=UPI001373E028|nr:hypothetical protein [Bradyrhizobium sp. CCBAU 051011]QHO79404.1 hypothetical protein ACH79_40235 [Bradyrhizobium sp. CCBAU 051011]
MRLVVALVAATILASSGFVVAPARAENGQIAAGVAGGLLGGMLLGGALAARPAPPPPVYYVPAAPRVYVEEPPPCRSVRERYWDGYSWVSRWVEVCD